MRIVVAYNDDAHLKAGLNPLELLGEEEVVAAATDVQETLSVEHLCSMVPVRDSLPDALAAIREAAPDMVFNFCEGVFGRTHWEAHFALCLEMLAIPFTGCSSIPLALCQDKGLVKRLLLAAGVPTPWGILVVDDADLLAFPRRIEDSERLLVKPSREDGGIGVDRESVVHGVAAVTERCRHIHGTYQQPALVEEFIAGDELNLAFFSDEHGRTFLPAGQVHFDPALLPEQRIVGWRAKWDQGSVEDLSTMSGSATLEASESRTLESIADAVAATLGIDGYCRIDFRRDSAGRFFVIDVNPNPDISPGSGFRKALDAAEMPFSRFLNQLMMARLRG